MKELDRDGTIICDMTVRVNGVLHNPAQAIITIKDPVGLPVVDEEEMTREGTGKYYYDYNPASNAKRGCYQVKCVAIEGLRSTPIEGVFYLK